MDVPRNIVYLIRHIIEYKVIKLNEVHPIVANNVKIFIFIKNFVRKYIIVNMNVVNFSLTINFIVDYFLVNKTKAVQNRRS